MANSQLETVNLTIENGVAWVTLNRPEVYNAFNTKMQDELFGIWRSLRDDDSVGAAVLTASGDKAFCTGIDRDEAMGQAEFSYAEAGSEIHFDDPGERLGPKQADLWKPVVAAVNGMACGGAFYMLGECDIIICADHATFFDPHVSYGMTSTYETVHMFHKMPFGELVRMQLLGVNERISAQRAYEIGLVSEVAPAGELQDRARWIAETIAAAPRAAVQATLRTAWACQEMSREQALGVCNAFLTLGRSDDALKQGQDAFSSGERPKPRIR